MVVVAQLVFVTIPLRYFITSLARLQRLHFCKPACPEARPSGRILQNMLNKRLSSTPVLTIEKKKYLDTFVF